MNGMADCRLFAFFVTCLTLRAIFGGSWIEIMLSASSTNNYSSTMGEDASSPVPSDFIGSTANSSATDATAGAGAAPVSAGGDGDGEGSGGCAAAAAGGDWEELEDHQQFLSPIATIRSKYLCLVRTSPGTVNDGDAQRAIIIMGLTILTQYGEIEPFDKEDLEFFCAYDVSRSELMYSIEVHKLFHKIDTAGTDEEFVVVVAQMNRLGIQINNISCFLDYISSRHCKIRFISIKEYGLNPYEVAKEMSRYYTTRFMIAEKSCHYDAGKDVSVEQSDEDKQNMVNEKTRQIQKDWDMKNHQLPVDLQMSVIDTSQQGHGDQLILDVVKGWIDTSLPLLSSNSQHEDIEHMVKEFIEKHTQPTDDNQFAGVTYAIYLRNSPKVDPLYINGLPQFQLAMCLAYSEIMFPYKGKWSIIHDRHEKRMKTGRDGVTYLFAAVIYGKIQHIFMRNINRFSGNIFLWTLFIEVCKQREVRIHIADGIGKSIIYLVRCEDERYEDLKKTNNELNATIERMRQPLIESGKKVMEVLADAHRKMFPIEIHP